MKGEIMYRKLLEFVDRHFRIITTILYSIIALSFIVIVISTIDSYAQVLDAKAEGLMKQSDFIRKFYSMLLETEEEVETEAEINETVVDETEKETESKETESETETEPLFSDEEIDWMEQESEALHGKYYDIHIDRALYTVQYFVDCGFSVEGACGIAGNIYAESNFDGSADNNGYYHGICQWSTNDRWIKIANYTYSNYGNTEDFFAQIDAILNSSDADSFQDEFAAMKNMTNAEEAAMYWLYYYEIAPGQAEQKRKDAANLVRYKYLLDQVRFA